MKKYNLKRFLASLLAVLMLASVTGVSPAVFAEDSYEEPILQSGSAVIANADVTKQVLAKTLISNYDKCDPDTRDNLDWQYYCTGDRILGLLGNKTETSWVSIDGYTHLTAKATYQYPSLFDNSYATYQVRIGSGKAVSFTKLEPQTLTYTLNENVSVVMPYTGATSVDYAKLEQLVLDAAIKESNYKLTLDNTDITYKATSVISTTKYVSFEGATGYPAVSEGTQQVKLSFKGEGAYSAKDIPLNVTFLGREASVINFKENPTVKILYNEDLSIKLPELKAAIWENVVDSTTPADLSTANVSIKYYAKAESGSLGDAGREWVDLNGGKVGVLTYPAISEGTWKLLFEFAGNADYKGFSKDVEVTFTGRDPAFELIKGVTEIDAKFADAKNLDTEAIANEIRNVLVEKLATDESIKLSDVKVEYKTSRIGSYKVLDKNASLDADDIGDTIHLRLSWGDGKGTAQYKPFEATVDIKLVDNRIPSVVALVDVANITYNMDASKMIEEIIKNAIDSANSTLPADYKASDFTVRYDDDGTWAPIEGEYKTILGQTVTIHSHLNAGAGQKILITYNGSKDYKPSAAVEGTLNVAKADVKVSMKLLTSVLAGQKVNKDVLKVTLDPNDPELDLYIVFVGFNTYKEKTIYVKLTEDQEKVIDTISDAQKGFPLYYKEEQTIRGKLNEGMTVDEFITYVDELMKNDTIKSALEKNGIDAEMLQNIVTALKSINKVTGDLRIAIGSPKHAGLYQAFAVAVNKNYNTGVGTGTVIVAMNAAGMKLEPNTELKKQTITVSEAEKYKKGEKAVATLTCDGDASDIDQSCIHYRFTGINGGKFYSSHDFPTAPGKYIVTVSVRGGDYYALPTTFTFTVKAD